MPESHPVALGFEVTETRGRASAADRTSRFRAERVRLRHRRSHDSSASPRSRRSRARRSPPAVGRRAVRTRGEGPRCHCQPHPPRVRWRPTARGSRRMWRLPQRGRLAPRSRRGARRGSAGLHSRRSSASGSRCGVYRTRRRFGHAAAPDDVPMSEFVETYWRLHAPSQNRRVRLSAAELYGFDDQQDHRCDEVAAECEHRDLAAG